MENSVTWLLFIEKYVLPTVIHEYNKYNKHCLFYIYKGIFANYNN